MLLGLFFKNNLPHLPHPSDIHSHNFHHQSVKYIQNLCCNPVHGYIVLGCSLVEGLIICQTPVCQVLVMVNIGKMVCSPWSHHHHHHHAQCHMHHHVHAVPQWHRSLQSEPEMVPVHSNLVVVIENFGFELGGVAEELFCLHLFS